MELCSITPVSNSQWMYESPFVMTLTHLAEKYPDYVEICKNRKNNYVITDNSIIEMGNSFSMDRVYKAAKALNSNEIILEDAYPDGELTIEAIERGLSWIVKNNHLGEFKLQAVCHGRNLTEFKKTFDYINSIKEIDVVGIPKVLSSWAPLGIRASLADIFTNTNKEIHYLGTWYSLKELIELPEDLRKRIRSCDTCLPSYYTINNMNILENRKGTIDLEKEYPKFTKEDYEKTLEIFKQYYKEVKNA